MGSRTSTIAIRNAALGESGELAALMLRSKAHWGYDDAFLEACRALLVIPEPMIAAGSVLVAERDGVRLGVASVITDPPDSELDVCFVEPVAMGQGVGRRLVGAAQELAVRRGARTMLVEADPNAREFYERLGAVLIGERTSELDRSRQLPLLRFDLAV